MSFACVRCVASSRSRCFTLDIRMTRLETAVLSTSLVVKRGYDEKWNATQSLSMATVCWDSRTKFILNHTDILLLHLLFNMFISNKPTTNHALLLPHSS